MLTNHAFLLPADPLHLELTVQQLAEKVTKLEMKCCQGWYIQVIFAQQQMPAASIISSWNQQGGNIQQNYLNQQAYSFNHSPTHTVGYNQQSSCFTPQHSAYIGSQPQQTNP